MIVWCAAGASPLSLCVGGGYALCALIRLAWFNVDEEERQKSSDGPREFYLGMPVTTIALLLPALLGLGRLYGWPLNPVGIGVLVFSGLAFLTPFRLKKPKLRGKICMLLCGCAELAILLMGVKL